MNYAWKGKGDKELLPARYYDDGHSLYLQWKAGTPMPALFDRDEEGREGLLNYRQQGSFVVVDGVPNTLVMRLGKDTAVLINRNQSKSDSIRMAGR
jgi:type IV secretion system protein VirB9